MDVDAGSLDPDAVREVARTAQGLGEALAALAAAVLALLPPEPAEEPEPVAPSLRPDTREPWLRKREAARHLNVSVRWIEAKVAGAGLPSYLVGGMRLFKASELDEWAAEANRRRPKRFHAASTSGAEPANTGSNGRPLAS